MVSFSSLSKYFAPLMKIMIRLLRMGKVDRKENDDILPFRPVWIQSYTSASSPVSTPRKISPVRSLYRSSFNFATCAA